MDSRSIDRLKHVLNTDVVRRMLVSYFKSKGFTESFDRLLHPGAMQDLIQAVPTLASKVEVEPHAIEVDPGTGKAVLGWNLFVLGTHRMYLGETYHRDLLDLARQIEAGQIVLPEGNSAARHQVTPRQVVNFVTRVLSRNESGYVDLTPPRPQSGNVGFGAARPNMSSGQFFSRGGAG